MPADHKERVLPPLPPLLLSLPLVLDEAGVRLSLLLLLWLLLLSLLLTIDSMSCIALSTFPNTSVLSSKLAVEKLAVETGQGSMLLSKRATLAVRTNLFVKVWGKGEGDDVG